jgi:citrate lyase subunit beta/citryl-CoA lyase
MTRSALIVAGDKQKHLDKLEFLKCDTAIVNLEDGVYNKDKARQMVVNKLKNINKKNTPKIVVRVNDLKSCGKNDIELFNKVKPDAIRVPKIKTKQDIIEALSLIDNDIKIELSIETIDALNGLSSFKIDKRITTVYLGILDMLESMKLPQAILTIENPTIDYLLSKFLVDSKIADLEPIFFTFQDYQDLFTFEEWCKKAKQMGYNGISCISPAQVDIANKIFTIDTLVLKRAKYIKEIFEYNKEQNNITGFTDELYGFIDEPIYKDALNIIENFKQG